MNKRSSEHTVTIACPARADDAAEIRDAVCKCADAGCDVFVLPHSVLNESALGSYAGNADLAKKFSAERASLAKCRGNVNVRFGRESGCTQIADGLLMSDEVKAGVCVFFRTAPAHVLSAERLRAFLRKTSADRGIPCLLVSEGVYGSTDRGAFDGFCAIAVDGAIVAESERFCKRTQLVSAKVPRPAAACFKKPVDPAAVAKLAAPCGPAAAPFVPSNVRLRSLAAEDMFAIQSVALALRAERCGAKRLVIGVSGGLDSTVALLSCVRAAEWLGWPRTAVLAATMPGFGTSSRTKDNASALAELLGVELRSIPIGPSVDVHFKDIGYDPARRDVTFENAQARMRTMILMDLANAENGIVVGTGDLSECALGWCTYNGDQMSMYDVNGNVPKTFLRAAVEAAAAKSADKKVAAVLRDIAATPISPELLPGAQETENIIGSYELHDFFIHHVLSANETRAQLLKRARRVFKGRFSEAEIEKTLGTFLRRLHRSQFKRIASPPEPEMFEVGFHGGNAWTIPSDMALPDWL